MLETLVLFVAIFVLEIVLEIDNITALRQAASRLPDTPLCRGQIPHAMALGLRVFLAYLLFHILAYTKSFSLRTGNEIPEQVGGMLIIFVSIGLILNYLQGGRNKRAASVRVRVNTKATTLAGFLVADALLSMDTVIAAVAMTSNFSLAVTAMIAAGVNIMLFHKQLYAWLQLNPRAALIAFIVIGFLGLNLILNTQGLHIPKPFLLVFVIVGAFLDRLDKNIKLRAARAKEKNKKARSQTLPQRSVLVQTKSDKTSQETIETPEWKPAVSKPYVRPVPVSTVDAHNIPLPVERPVKAETFDGLADHAYVFGTTHSAGLSPDDAGVLMGCQNVPDVKDI